MRKNESLLHVPSPERGEEGALPQLSPLRLSDSERARIAPPSDAVQSPPVPFPVPFGERPTQPGSLDDYAFLIGRYLDPEVLVNANKLASEWDMPLHQVLIAKGWLSSEQYYAALAEMCGVEFIDFDELEKLSPPPGRPDWRFLTNMSVLRCQTADRIGVAIVPERTSPSAFGQAMDKLGEEKNRVAVTAPNTIRNVILKFFKKGLVGAAIYGLENSSPGQSARQGVLLWQSLLLTGLIGLIIGISLITPSLALTLLVSFFSFFFLSVVLLRLIACFHCLFLPTRSPQSPGDKKIEERHLPHYTVLVPLFREKRVLPRLIESLIALDYPAAKLDIKLIFEAADFETYAMALKLNLPENMDIIVVPDLQPRTKPKALNYALQFARGEYAVIYDAEDRPEPDQLLKAVAAFRKGPSSLVCLQARLNIYNPHENWLTKQFTIEYSALFDGFLPALQWMRLPIPLGGTSNHFRMASLREAGGWDAFNVTEDADLGMRLYRRGWVSEMLPSTTYEEASVQLKSWIGQRTRWLKGWIQTYFVHMRAPAQLLTSLGFKRFWGFQAIIGGVIISALIHPLFYLFLIYEMVVGAPFSPPESAPQVQIFWLTLFNLAGGYLAAMGLALMTLIRRGFYALLLQIMLIPFYWLLISFAAYRAVYQFIEDPFYWEKTEHGLGCQSPIDPLAGKALSNNSVSL